MDKKTNGNNKENLRNTVIILVALMLFGYGIFQLASIYLAYRKAGDEYADIKERFITEEMNLFQDGDDVPIENPIDFKGLKSKNKDVIGWLMMEGLDISYPIMQSKDNEYYLNHTFERNTHFAGSIFMDCENKLDFTNDNTILYGHNMRDGSMFGCLKKYGSQEVYEKNPYIWIYTQDKVYQYKIFSCREVAVDSDSYQRQFVTEKEFETYVERAVGESIIKTKGDGILNYKGDTIITLSTCTSNDNIRLLVQGICIAVYECK